MGAQAEFTGRIPERYDRFLGTLLFRPYAAEIVRRIAAEPCSRVLETAAGTGVVTRSLAETLATTVAIDATDLSPAMVEYASGRITRPNLCWHVADAQALPFEDGSFDAAVCQFGMMFLPDKSVGYREARRVLRQGGRFVFTTWHGLSANSLAELGHGTLGALFPNDPPQFLAQTPYGYCDTALIESALKRAGFDEVQIESVEKRSRSPRARDVAIGFYEGTPLHTQILDRDAAGLERALDAFERELRKRYGDGAIDAPMNAFIVTAR